MNEPKISRIDIIGQNGNDGLHYNPAAGVYSPKKLINDHWAYLAGVLSFVYSKEKVAEIEYHYKSAFEHGWKHCKEHYGIN